MRWMVGWRWQGPGGKKEARRVEGKCRGATRGRDVLEKTGSTGVARENEGVDGRIFCLGAMFLLRETGRGVQGSGTGTGRVTEEENEEE